MFIVGSCSTLKKKSVLVEIVTKCSRNYIKEKGPLEPAGSKKSKTFPIWHIFKIIVLQIITKPPKPLADISDAQHIVSRS